jgi:glycerol kinase
MKSIVLAIDEGTTGATAMLIDFSKPTSPKVVGRSNHEFQQHFPKPGWVEHDLDQIWAAIRAATNDAIKNTNGAVGAKDICAIGITNQRETLCVFNRKTSKPSCKAIVWQCRRSSDLCKELKSSGLGSVATQKTGLVLDPYFTGTKIRWLMENNPTIKKEIEQGTSVFGTIDTYVLHRLSGGSAFATESSNASRTLLYNLRGGWDNDMCKTLGVPTLSSLPDVLPSSGVFGHTKGLDFLPDGIPITGIVGDQQAAMAGQACFSPGEAKCTYGTGAFLLLNTGDQPVFSKEGLLTTIAWNIDGKLTYALEGAAFVAGAAIQFLRDQFGFLPKSADAERLAAGVYASPYLYFVPSLTGLGGPYWDSEARGAFLGMHRGTTKNEVILAALEGIAFQVTDLAKSMAEDHGQSLKVIRADGGAATNDLLMQFQSNLLSVPVDRPKDIETTAIGAGLFAALGVGIYKNLGELSLARQSDKVFKPVISDNVTTMIKKQYAGWSKAIAAVRLFGSGAE